MKRMMRLFYPCIFCIILLACGEDNDIKKEPVPAPETIAASFVNPLLNGGPDPWVAQKDGMYYFTCTVGDRVALYPTKKMSELGSVNPVTVYTPPAGQKWSKNIWAPEMHFLAGKWYIYFAADDGKDENHRMYVLENSSAVPTEGTWELKGQLKPTTDRWAIDGSVLEQNGQLYFLWSGWREGSGQGQQIYIAKMSNPYTISGDRVLLSEASFDWEKRGGNVNEGPEILKNKDGRVYMTYSASSCFTDDYCLGLLTLKAGGNPMNPADWTKSEKPVFTKQASAYGPGHNGFFVSPDGTENWIVYHANPQTGQGCGGQRSPRMQKFSWKADGSPDFGEPVAVGMAVKKPSGE